MMRAVLTPDGRQRILGTVPHYAIETEDLRAQPPDRVAARLAQKRAGMCGQVLDAERWPLFDLRATREPAGVTRLHLDLDLLMFDVQSFHILLAELERSYRDPAAQLPAIGLSFRDYLLAGRDAAGEAAYLADKAWWQARLSEIAPPRGCRSRAWRPTWRGRHSGACSIASTHRRGSGCRPLPPRPG